MRIWLLTVGEPLPTDNGPGRAWRTGLLAKQLVKRNHEVVWWSSEFDHFQRHKRPSPNTPISVSAGLTVWHLAGIPYRRNVSVARVRNHRQVASNFRRFAATQPRPNLILSSLPTLELCRQAVDYGAEHRVPVALDVRDLWPDVVIELVSAPLRGIAQRATRWMTRDLEYATRNATAILGITNEFVQWGLHAGGRVASGLDRAFPMAYVDGTPEATDLARADAFWDARGLSAREGRFIVCFFGTLGWMFDFDTVVAAAKRLSNTVPEVTFVICGSGERQETLRQRTGALPSVILPGRIGAAEIHSLMRRASAGLAPYRPFRNFQDNLPNKPIEYLSAGLPIVASRLKVLAKLLAEHECGVSYEPGDDRGLADAIEELSKNAVRRLGMSRCAQALYREEFVADRVYERMVAHLETIALENGTVGRPLELTS